MKTGVLPSGAAGEGRALILDAEAIAALDVVRSLARRNVTSLALGDARTLLRYSRFGGRRRLISLRADLDPSAVVAEIARAAGAWRPQVIMPLGAGSTWLLSTRGREIRAAAPEAGFLVPSPEQLAATLDKAILYRRAVAAEVAVPVTWLPADVSEVETLARARPGPWVVKPRVTSGARGMVTADHSRDLPDAYRLVAARFPWPLVQERLPARAKIQVGVLHRAASGPLAVSCLEVLRHYPPAGGPSTCVVTRTDREAVSEALRFLAILKWDGLAHLEFLRDDRDGRLRLIDFNPRVWGTLGASLAGGVDFPALLYDHLTGNGDGRTRGSAPAASHGPIEVEGRLWRRLFFADMALYLTPRRRRGAWRGPSFWRLSGFREATWDRGDPWPLAVYLGRTVARGWLSREVRAFYGGAWGLRTASPRDRSIGRTLEDLMESEVAALVGPPRPGPIGAGGRGSC